MARVDRALAEAGDDPALRARVLAFRALSTAAEGVERIRDAEAWALEALPELDAIRALGWARALRGRDLGEVCALFREHARAGRAARRRARAARGAAALVARGDRAGAGRDVPLPRPRGRARRGGLLRVAAAEPDRARAARGRVGRGRAAARRVGGRRRRPAADHPDLPALPRAAGGGSRRPRGGPRVGRARAGRGRGPRLPLAGPRVHPRARVRGAAGRRPARRGRAPARGLDLLRARGRRRPRRVPRRPGPGRDPRRAGRARRGPRGHPPPGRGRGGDGHPWAALTARRCAALIDAGDLAADRRRATSGSGCGSTRPAACSRTAARSGGSGSGRSRGTRSARPRRASTRSARPAGRSSRGRSSSRVGGRKPRARRRAHADRGAGRAARVAGPLEPGDRARAVRHRAHGRGAPVEHVREARRAVARAARRSPKDWGSGEFRGGLSARTVARCPPPQHVF